MNLVAIIEACSSLPHAKKTHLKKATNPMSYPPPTPVESKTYDEELYRVAIRRLAENGDAYARHLNRTAWPHNTSIISNVRIASIHYESNPELKAFYKRVKRIYAPMFVLKRVTQ